MSIDAYDRCRNADRGRSLGHVLQDYGVCPDKRMVSNFHTPQYFGASPDAYVPSQDRCPGLGTAGPYRHLLEYQAVGSN